MNLNNFLLNNVQCFLSVSAVPNARPPFFMAILKERSLYRQDERILMGRGNTAQEAIDNLDMELQRHGATKTMNIVADFSDDGRDHALLHPDDFSQAEKEGWTFDYYGDDGEDGWYSIKSEANGENNEND